MTKQSEIIGDPRYIPVHKHGFVGLVDTMGSDADICQAARVSYGEGTKSISDDRNLIRYLMRHRHTSPFEMAEVKFHIKLPIFVMRQLITHRTANKNEYSARYSELSDEFYVPDEVYMKPQSTTNKQGSAGEMPLAYRPLIKGLMEGIFHDCHKVYKMLLEPDKEQIKVGGELGYPGLARELARLVMPVANYTECYFKFDLHNFFHMCSLRMEAHAQQEIQDFANAMYKLVAPKFHMSCEAFMDYRFFGKSLSRMEIQCLLEMIAGEGFSGHPDMSKREVEEFKQFWQVAV